MSLYIVLLADVTVPDDLPTFRTIPQRTIVLSEDDSIGVLACSIQRYNDTTELVIRQQPGGGSVVTGFFFFPPSIFGYSHIPQANLLINLTDFENPSDFVSETYVCSLDGTGMEHSATFIRQGIYVHDSNLLCAFASPAYGDID